MTFESSRYALAAAQEGIGKVIGLEEGISRCVSTLADGRLNRPITYRGSKDVEVLVWLWISMSH
jgi:hypothetical protein